MISTHASSLVDGDIHKSEVGTRGLTVLVSKFSYVLMQINATFWNE